MQITVDPTPMPPWAGLKFRCQGKVGRRRCPAEYQLEAADKCMPIKRGSGVLTAFATPKCWDCGAVSIIKIAVQTSAETDEEVQCPS